MNWLLNRLREASTWRGLVWLLTVSGVALRPDQVEAIVLAGMAIAGLLGVFLQDKVRDPNERTRKTDIPEIELVGRSESTDAPGYSISPSIVFDGSADECMSRMLKSQLPSDTTVQSSEQGSGWNG